MLNRLSIATFCALLVGLFAVSTASAAQPSDRAPLPPPTTYWQDKGFILMAHQGGEWDFPPNTMYAYKKAMELGADMLDMDAYVTQTGELVLTHDRDASDNSEAPNDTFIDDLSLDELKALDFAYKWTPHGSPGGTPPPFRGVATGSVTPPPGFTKADFQIPTFDEVLDAFPETPINIELKQVSGVSIEDTVEAAADVLAAHPGHNENVIINSFGQDMLTAMHAERPAHLSYSGSLSGSLAYIQGQPIEPRPVAIEPPDMFNLPPWVDTVPILKPWADHDGYKIFVWGSDHNPDQDTDAFYAKLIQQGADSYNTPSPTTLAAYLCTAGVARPDGSPRCDEQICPVGQEGIAPNDCHDIPACPPNTTGTPPNCVPVVVPPNPKAKLKLLSFKLPKLLKPGKKAKASVKIKNVGDARLTGVKICLKTRGNIASGVIRGTCRRQISLGAAKVYEAKITLVYKATQGKTGKTKSLRALVSKAKQGKTGKAKMSLRITTDNGGNVNKTKQLLYTAKAGKTGSASGK